MTSARQWWQATRAWSVQHVGASDAMLAVVLGLLALGGYYGTDPAGSERSHDIVGALLIIGQAGSFAWRRLRPWHSLIGVVVFSVAFWAADYPTDFDAFTVLSVYAAAAHGGHDRRVVFRRVGLAVAGLSTVVALGVLSPDDDIPAVALVGITTIHLTAALIGQAVYDRRRRITELQERAERAEAERELLARQAVLDERSRIARELHDVVAHGMSVIVVQAGAAERSIERDPGATREALENIQSVGRQSLGEMRRMLGALRHDDDAADLNPQPGLANLDQIVAHCNQSGLPTELIIDDVVPHLTAGQDITTYRVVQESLTNVLKHGGDDARASVHVTCAPDSMRIEVVDTGVGSSATNVARSSGQGIVGMRERVEMFGGRLRAGPRPGGGFRVLATLPVDMPADMPADAPTGEAGSS